MGEKGWELAGDGLAGRTSCEHTAMHIHTLPLTVLTILPTCLEDLVDLITPSDGCRGPAGWSGGPV